ncbi:porphobilinogen deaminase [Campylobacter curvus]|uniref:porphobilinogen deaminase n=1 Tax=Campylobacter curvus TaxID=200 RepID=UPI002015FFB1|nr:porphobilinogen deaminase [Campylobacter curvus]
MTLEYMDIYLGEALECLDSAGAELVKYKNESQNDEKLEAQELLFVVSKSITELWKAREILYERKPDLKQNFKKEFDADPKKYEELSKISQAAQKLEQDGKLKETVKKYEELLKRSNFRHFALVAQAGLYRCSKK